jgi:hypothetical protein
MHALFDAAEVLQRDRDLLERAAADAAHRLARYLSDEVAERTPLGQLDEDLVHTMVGEYNAAWLAYRAAHEDALAANFRAIAAHEAYHGALRSPQRA